MSQFAYSVMIKLGVANLASAGVKLLGKDLLAAHGNAVKLEDKLKSLKMMAVGYGLERAGQGILSFLGQSIDASKEYTRQLSLMNGAGMSHLEIARATAAAWQTSRTVITSSAAENLAAIRELRSVFGNGHMGEAYGILPTVQRTSAILEALKGQKQEGVAFDLVKSAELRTPGVMTLQRLQQNADLMTRSLMAFGGTLGVNDFHMALKQSRTAALGLNDDFVYNYLPTLMQEVKTKGGGAQTAGTAIMSAYQQIIGGVVKKSAIPLWQAMGQLAPGSVVKNAGGQLQVKPGGFVNSALFAANPYAYAQTLAPVIGQYAAGHHMGVNQVIAGMFGNRMAQWLMTTMIGKSAQFERDKTLIATGGNSYEIYQKLLKSNPQLAEEALHSQWNNIQSIIGYKFLPIIVPWMVKFANGLDRIAQFAQAHPNLTSGAVFGAAAAGVGATVGGKVLMTAGIMKFLGISPGSIISGALGILSKGIGLLGNALLFLGRALFMNPIGLTILAIAAAAYLLYRNWKTVGPYVKEVWSIIRAVFHVSMHFIAEKAKEMWTVVGPYVTKAWSMMKSVGVVIGDTFGGIYHAITGWLGKLVNWIANSAVGRAIGWAGGEFNQAYAWSQGVNRQYEGSPFTRPGQTVHVTVHNTTKIGDKTVANHVAHHIAKAMSAPSVGGSRADSARYAPRP